MRYICSDYIQISPLVITLVFLAGREFQRKREWRRKQFHFERLLKRFFGWDLGGWYHHHGGGLEELSNGSRPSEID